MIVKYLTGYSADKIERVEVLRETDSFVYVPGYRGAKERREGKRTEFAQYHDSWEEARTYLLDKATNKVTEARRVLQRANDKLGNIKGMKNPEKQP